MQTLLNILKSRTNWVTLIVLATNSVQYLTPFVTPEELLLINSILAALGVYFRVNPKAKY